MKMRQFVGAAVIALIFGGGLATWLVFLRPRPPIVDTIDVLVEAAKRRDAQVQALLQKSPPFAYTLVPNCKVNWVNYERKRLLAKDTVGLSCGEECAWEPLGIYIPEDTSRYYAQGAVHEYPPSETVPEAVAGCFPPVDGVCAVSNPVVTRGEAVTFAGWGTGGSGLYVYSWVGDDGIFAQTREVVKSFTTKGRKSATVRITSNGQSIYKTCEVLVR